MGKKYSLKEAAAELGVEPQKLREWIKKLGIVPHKVTSYDKAHGYDGRHFLITQKDFAILKKSITSPMYHQSALTVLGRKVDTQQEEIMDLKQRLEALEEERYRGSSERELLWRFGGGEEDASRAREAFKAAIEFIWDETQQRQSSSAPRARIYVTHQRSGGLLSFAPQLRSQWWGALRGALERGWDVVHLIRDLEDDGIIDDSRPRMLLMALNKLLGAWGNYKPQYFPMRKVGGRLPRPYTLDNPPEFIVVPGQAGLVLSPSAHSRYTDQHEVRRTNGSKSPVGELEDYVDACFAESVGVLTDYRGTSPDFATAIAQAEWDYGQRMLFMRGLSQSSMPWEIHNERAKSVSDQVWATAMLEALKQREEGLRAQLEVGTSIREICTMESITDYVRTGHYADDDPFFQMGGRVLYADEIRQHLRYLIDRLRNPKYNYELAIVEEEYLRRLDISLATWWMVKEGHSVLLETWDRASGGGRAVPEIDLVITNRAVVGMFLEFFVNEIWEKLPSERKRRENTALWLEKQIDIVSAGTGPI